MGLTEPREGLVGDLHEQLPPGRARPLVEAGPVSMDEAKLGHFGFQRVHANPMIDAVELAEHVGDAAAIVAVEVAANPGPEVVGLADVDDLPGPVREEIDPRAPGEADRSGRSSRSRPSPGQSGVAGGHPGR